MTLPILIYADDPLRLNHYQRIIENTIIIYSYDMQVMLTTTDVQDLRAYMQQHQQLTKAIFVFVIDSFSDQSVIDVAADICRQNGQAQIVCVTADDETVIEPLKRRITALALIEKGDHDKAQIRSLLAEVAHTTGQLRLNSRNFFTFKVGSRQIRVDVDAIYFIEASSRPHCVVLHGEGFQYEFYGKLRDIASAYPALMRVKKSYLINPAQIRCIDYKKGLIQFSDSLTCTFPVRMVHQLRQLK